MLVQLRLRALKMAELMLHQNMLKESHVWICLTLNGFVVERLLLCILRTIFEIDMS